MEWVTPVLITVCAFILTAILYSIRQLESRIFLHLTNADVHEAGFARTEEQIKNLLQTVRVAHERIDRLKEA